MPVARVTLPDGRVIRVEAPEGTSEEAIRAQVEQFLAKPTARPAIKDDPAPNPVAGMNALELFLAGTGKGFHGLGTGLGQFFSGGTAVTGRDVAETRKRDKPLTDTTAGRLGEFLGMVAPSVPLAFLPGANTMAGAAALGALSGAASPAESGSEKAVQMVLGPLAGMGGLAAVRAIPALAEGARGLAEPLTDTGQEAIAGRVIRKFAADPEAVAAAAAGGGTIVPGTVPTLAEATRDPGIAQLQRAVQSMSPEAASRLADRAAANNAARVQALQRIAGEPGALDAAVAARSEETAPLYEAARGAPITPDEILAALFERPSIQSKAAPRAARLASEMGGEAPSKMTSQDLHYIKMALDDLVAENNARGLAGWEQKAIERTRQELIGWLEQASPEWAAAQSAYREMSAPIDKMKTGQAILDRFTGGTLDYAGNPRLQANALAQALKDEPALVSRATGFSKAKGLESVLGDADAAAVRAVAEDAGRYAAMQEAARVPGSPTAQYLAAQQTIGNSLGSALRSLGIGEKTADRMANAMAPRWLEAVYATPKEKILARVTDATLFPNMASTMMASPGAVRVPYMAPDWLQRAAMLGGPVAEGAAF